MPNDAAQRQRKREADRRQKEALKDWLGHAGLSGEYLALIDTAVRKDWGQAQFLQRLVHTRTFRHSYPGLVERNGTLADLFTGKAGAPLSAGGLSAAIARYDTYQNEYQKAAKDYGFRWNRNMMLNVIRQEVSPDEFRARAAITWTVDNTPGLQEFYDKALRQYGIKGVNTQQQLYRLAAGTGGRRFEDIYETARLAAGGLGLGAKEAKTVAQKVGQPGQAIDIAKLVSEARQNIATVGPELQSQGISNADLVKFLADPEGNPDLAGKLNQVLQARKSLGSSYVPGIRPQRGPAGGVTQYRPEGAAQYG